MYETEQVMAALQEPGELGKTSSSLHQCSMLIPREKKGLRALQNLFQFLAYFCEEQRTHNFTVVLVYRNM